MKMNASAHAPKTKPINPNLVRRLLRRPVRRLVLRSFSVGGSLGEDGSLLVAP
jgi:hypothetical protein